MLGVPQGLNSLANQNAVYYQADPGPDGRSAGLLRTFCYLGAIVAVRGQRRLLRHRAPTPRACTSSPGSLLAVGLLFLVMTVFDRSLAGSDGIPPRPARPGVTVPVTTLDPSAALVVVDLQQGVPRIDAAHPMDGVVAHTAELADAFRARRPAGRPGHGDRPRAGTHRRGRARQSLAARSRATGRTSWTSSDPAPTDHRVTKQRWGAFTGTELDCHLRRRGVTQIVLTGIATSTGVESTARAAHEHGYHVMLATDAMTDRDADAHAHSIERIFPRLGETATTAEILALLARR